MSKLANSDATERGQAPPVGGDVEPAGTARIFGSERIRNIARMTTEPPTGGVPDPIARPAGHALVGHLAPMGSWDVDNFTGAHGVIGHRTVGQPAGGMQPWDQQRRTLRGAPGAAWDAGVVVNPLAAK